MKTFPLVNMKNHSDNDDMSLVDSSDEGSFLSATSNDSWIFPMAKPPPDADYDQPFIELVQEMMDKQDRPPVPAQENSSLEYSSIEQGRREQVSMEETPLFMQDNDPLSVPDFKSSSTNSDDIQYEEVEDFMQELPPWLCLDNEVEMSQFKDHLDNCLEKEPEKSKVPLPKNVERILPLTIQDLHLPEDQSSFFFDQIVMTSTPNLPRSPSKPFGNKYKSESRLPSPVHNPLKRKLNQKEDKSKPIPSKSNSKTHRVSQLPKAIPRAPSRSQLNKSPSRPSGAKSAQVQAKPAAVTRPTFQPRIPGRFQNISILRSKASVVDDVDNIFGDETVEKRRAEMFGNRKPNSKFVFNLQK